MASVTIALVTGAAVGLLGVATDASAATPVPLIQPAAGTIAGTGLRHPLFAFYRIWGDPSETANVVRPGWRTYTRTVWRRKGLTLVVSFRDVAERNAGGVSYRGPLRTARGDHRGTTLRTFVRHWPEARVGVLTATVGRTMFVFDETERLVGVELGTTPFP